MIAVLVLLVVLVAGCSEETAVPHEPPAAVPGLETAVAEVATVQDEVRGFASVAAAGDPPALQDARAQLAGAEARRRLAAEQVRRLEPLARGAVVPRKELEAARAEQATAAALATRAAELLAAFGAPSSDAPLAAGEVWVIAHVQQRDVARVTGGAAGRFVADAFPGRTFDGRVEAGASYVDAATLTAPIRLRLRDADGLLRPGMTGAAVVLAGPPRAAMLLPTAAVVYDGARPVVLRDGGDGRFVIQAVTLGETYGDRVEVVSGLEAGQRVATTGAASLLSAMRLAAGGAAD